MAEEQSGSTPVRTARISDDVWTKAKKRATKDNLNMSNVMSRLVEAYSRGMVDVPKVKLVYPEAK